MPLDPLVSSGLGQQHPDFPATILAFYLLTSTQLDNLARHFHQIWPPVDATSQYPVQMAAWIGTSQEHETSLYTKRLRFGLFIGLRGCGMPLTDCQTTLHSTLGDHAETWKTAEALRRTE